MTKEERLEIELRAKPQPPKKYELGGGYYYKCHWLSCREDLKRWYNYCPQCGSAIDWEGADYEH